VTPRRAVDRGAKFSTLGVNIEIPNPGGNGDVAARLSCAPPRQGRAAFAVNKGLDGKALSFWSFVGIPIAWGVWIT
jgi:hypothetical protein